MKANVYQSVTNSKAVILEVTRGYGKDGYSSAKLQLPKRLSRKMMDEYLSYLDVVTQRKTQ